MSTRDEQFREQLAYREFLREEEKRQREQELIQAVAENLPADDSGGKPQGAPELDEDVITQRADEFRQKSADAAARAEEYAQGALKAESRGDMGSASILWKDSMRFDRKSKNYGKEALRYDGMRKVPGTARKEKSPGAKEEKEPKRKPAETAGVPATPAEETSPDWQEYLKKSARQVVLGNYTDDVTLAGTAGQVALGLLGADLPADIRDLTYDLTHLKTTPWYQTVGDALALLPIVGGLKYADEAAALIKGGRKAAEAAGDAVKHGDELVDAGGELVYNGAKQFGDIELMPDDLMEELAASGVKYTPEDVLMVTRNSNGDLLWLEKGHEGKDGFVHILEDHAINFEDQGYTTEQIPELLKSVLDTNPIRVTSKNGGLEAVYNYNGHNYTVGYGTNGYVVSFYPSKGKKR